MWFMRRIILYSETKLSWSVQFYSGFSQTHNIGNNANIGIRGFTTWKQKNSNKILPPVSIEPLAQDPKSRMLPLP